jgi:hypothetical protein
MTAIGGSLESITIRGRNFAVAADAEANRKLGGFENEVMANGDGTARKIMTRVPLSIDGVAIVIDDGRGDHEFLQEVADLNDFVTIALTYASGITWQGSATIVGEFQASSQSATAPISLMGPGVLTRQ